MRLSRDHSTRLNCDIQRETRQRNLFTEKTSKRKEIKNQLFERKFFPELFCFFSSFFGGLRAFSSIFGGWQGCFLVFERFATA